MSPDSSLSTTILEWLNLCVFTCQIVSLTRSRDLSGSSEGRKFQITGPLKAKGTDYNPPPPLLEIMGATLPITTGMR